MDFRVFTCCYVNSLVAAHWALWPIIIHLGGGWGPGQPGETRELSTPGHPPTSTGSSLPQTPLVSNSNRAFVQAPKWHVDQHPEASEGLHTQENQQWHNQGTGHVLWLHGAAEGHISASLGETKCGPLEKGIANHFNILALRTPWTVWKH